MASGNGVDEKEVQPDPAPEEKEFWYLPPIRPEVDARIQSLLEKSAEVPESLRGALVIAGAILDAGERVSRQVEQLWREVERLAEQGETTY